jgi:hypothetical protein
MIDANVELGIAELTVDLPKTCLGHLPQLLGAVARGDVRSRGHAPMEYPERALESRTEPLARDGHGSTTGMTG